jgi:hypothetical protein
LIFLLRFPHGLFLSRSVVKLYFLVIKHPMYIYHCACM